MGRSAAASRPFTRPLPAAARPGRLCRPSPPAADAHLRPHGLASAPPTPRSLHETSAAPGESGSDAAPAVQLPSTRGAENLTKKKKIKLSPESSALNKFLFFFHEAQHGCSRDVQMARQLVQSSCLCVCVRLFVYFEGVHVCVCMCTDAQ